MNIGSSISAHPDGGYEIPSTNTKPAIPISTKLRSIVLAFDERLWTVLPENDETYESLNIALKKSNLERTLFFYPFLSGASISTGMFTSIQFLQQAVIIGLNL